MSSASIQPSIRRFVKPTAIVAVLALVAINALVPSGGGSRPQGPATPAALDAWFDDEMRDAAIPGAAMVVVRDGAVVDTHVYGVADDAGRPITPSTPFVIGSLTKSITALAVMQLIGDGRLTLDTPISEVLRDTSLAKAPDKDSITVRDLLDQTSGFPTAAGLAPFSTPVTSLAQRVDDLATTPLLSAPGAVYHYSNANYLVLGRIVEIVAGTSFDAYVRTHVFQPIGMRDATAAKPSADVTLAHRLWFGRPTSNQPLWRADMVPAGFVSASADDLGRYLLAQLGEVPAGLTPDALDAMHQGVAPTGLPEQRYGYGWVDGRLGDERIVSHTGSTTDMASMAVLVPGEHLAVAILMNGTSTLYETLHKPDTIGLAATALLLGQEPPGTIRLLYPGFIGLSAVVIVVIASGIIRQVRGQRRPRAIVRLDPRWSVLRAFRLTYRAYLDVVVPVAIILFLPGAFATDWSVMARIDIGQVLLVIAALRVIDGIVRVRGRLRDRSSGAVSADQATADAPAGLAVG